MDSGNPPIRREFLRANLADVAQRLCNDVSIVIGGHRFGSAGGLALPKIVPFSFMSHA